VANVGSPDPMSMWPQATSKMACSGETSKLNTLTFPPSGFDSLFLTPSRGFQTKPLGGRGGEDIKRPESPNENNNS
jgi:hypothetical protein